MRLVERGDDRLEEVMVTMVATFNTLVFLVRPCFMKVIGHSMGKRPVIVIRLYQVM